MSKLLKQSTATTINIGPFVKIADGSLEEAATVANVDVVIIKHSDTSSATHTHIVPAASASANDMVLVDNGMWNLELTTANVDTLGRLDVTATYTGCFPVFDSFMVVAAASYDANVTGDVAAVPDVWSLATTDGAFSASGGVGEYFLGNLLTAASIFSENAQGVPSATPTLNEILMNLYAARIMKYDEDANYEYVYDSNGVVIWKRAKSTPSVGRTSRAKAITGP